MSATSVPSRTARASSASRRSAKPRRFRQPVSGSVRDSSASSSRWRSPRRACHTQSMPVSAMQTRNIPMYAASGSAFGSATPPTAPSTATPVTVAATTMIIDPSGYDSAANTSVRKSISVAGLVMPTSR